MNIGISAVLFYFVPKPNQPMIEHSDFGVHLMPNVQLLQQATHCNRIRNGYGGNTTKSTKTIKP